MHKGLLPAAAGSHVDFHIEGQSDQCVLKKILDGQADPNATGHLVTPLQITVATCDIEGVAELLEAGADANATGDQNGVSFKANSILEWSNELHGLSPLHICRKFVKDIEHHKWIYRNRESNSPAIEALLLQHGARDFFSLS